MIMQNDREKEARDALEQLFDRRKRSSSSAYEERCYELRDIVSDALISAAPDSGMVAIRADDLRIVLNPPATQDRATDQLIADAEARLSAALKDNNHAER